ncbi:hypothetical protein CGJ35_26700, partial [Vibrio parahaemolyticus]
IERLKLATAMQLESWELLIEQTQQHMNKVHQVFETLIGDDEEDEGSTIARHFHELWDMANKQDVLELILDQDIQVEEPAIFSKSIINFKADLAKKTLGPRGREV